MVRLGISRMSYTINPGLYKIGSPDQNSPILVSANYKLSFDALRSNLTARDLWILVIDTKGINVWCSAGKGTFNSSEIVRMINLTNLSQKAAGRKLILPQLSAPGVSAHEIYRLSGFRVIYGPVRAKDIPEFIDAGFTATPEMRHIEFGLKDRLILSPVEITMGLKYALIIALGIIMLSGIGKHGYSIEHIKTIGVTSVILLMSTFIGSAVLGSALLPWLPGRAFAVKGLFLGVLMVIVLIGFNSMVFGIIHNWMIIISWVFMIPALSSFIVMNFTGATTFTSLSGVLYEMRYAIPAQIAVGIIGLTLWVSGLFI
ncbi:MAG: acetyl-CoA synthase subunit gamma [Nitrospirae bacterium]|nr:acetyl-CoA synthase subunit gamma [Nitrospirota bacterium]